MTEDTFQEGLDALELPWPPEFLEGDDDADNLTSQGEARLGTRHTQRALRRAQKARAKQAHGLGRTRELRALLDVLGALPTAVPALSSAFPNGTPSTESPNQRPQRRKPDTTPVDINDVEASLHAAEGVLGVGLQRYAELPTAWGPVEAIEILGSMVERPPKYQEKYLGQELSLLSKVHALVSGASENKASGALAIVDIGAGNGCLALLAALILDGVAVLIDHTKPPLELCVEEKVPERYRNRILRITGDVADLDVDRDVLPLLQQHGVGRAVVIAKHLCGVGTDLALGLIRRWCGSGGCVPLLGAVIATCCGHKIGAEDRKRYAALHEEDTYLAGLTESDPARLQALLALCTRCVAWRTTAGALGSRITPQQVRAAELFEDALQQPRLRLLQRAFPAAAEVLFIDKEKSPQNRCLLAGSPQGLHLACNDGASSGTCETKAVTSMAPFVEALQMACGELLEANGGKPVDLKPHGFVSAKYDYDGN